MRVVFFGTPEFALPSLQILLQRQSSFEVVGLVCQPDRPQGRGQKVLPPPTKVLAQAHGIPVWQPVRLRRDPEVLAALEALAADVFVVVAYGQILPPAVLQMPRLGCVNVHASLLPAYRGAAPIQWAIANGETETGVTTMLMDEGLDTGAILLQAKLPIGPEQTGLELASQLAQLGAELLVETLVKLEKGEITPIPQDDSRATYAPLLKKQDFQLDWRRPAQALHNQIRAFSPDCFTGLQGKRIKIVRSAAPQLHPPPDPLLQGSPGEVVGLARGEGVYVATGEGSLLIRRAQLPGRKEQSAWDLVNGGQLRVGMCFEALPDP
ncbi:methionyl-tRNA formyltransferase [Synechococcus sp. H55.7]|uniref:methionyl-tRNA formyltransferase n=1 Tax=unclassified Synechococcus TaxID=2626047 RepID=UPI0039C3C7AE